MISSGAKQIDIPRKLKVHRNTVKNWIKQFDKGWHKSRCLTQYANVYNKKLPHSLRKFKNLNSRVYGLSGITGAILQAWFHWDDKLFTGIELKKIRS